MTDNGEARILERHLRHLRERLIQYAEHAGIATHGDVVGAAREGFARIFLEQNLPSAVEFKTGQIIDKEDTFSGQVDLYLQSIDAPKIFLDGDLQVAFIDSVIGVIEVKSTLTTAAWDKPSHLRSAFEQFRKIKALKRDTHLSATLAVGGPWTHPNTPCFLVAYKGPPLKTLAAKIESFAKEFDLPYEEFCPEVCVVLERGYSCSMRDGLVWHDALSQTALVGTQSEYCLAELFMYLSKSIQSWNARERPVNFTDFFVGGLSFKGEPIV